MHRFLIADKEYIEGDIRIVINKIENYLVDKPCVASTITNGVNIKLFLECCI